MIDRLTVLGRLATEPDAQARRTLFESLAPVWRVVDGDGRDASPYRRLLRASAARWAEHGSPIEANAVALGLPAAALEGMLHEVLGASNRGTTGMSSAQRPGASTGWCRPIGCRPSTTSIWPLSGRLRAT